MLKVNLNLRNSAAIVRLCSVQVVACLAVSIMFSGCKKDDGDKNQNQNQNPVIDYLYGVEKGTIVYKKTSWYDDDEPEVVTQKVIFDKQGKQFRLEDGEGYVYIADDIAKKFWMISLSEEKYWEMDNASAGFNTAYLYWGDDLNSIWSKQPGYKKESNKTIAGKNCTVYSWNSDGEKYEWGGWSRITFWMHSYEGSPGSDGATKLEATSFTESIPSGNNFLPPSDFTKITF